MVDNVIIARASGGEPLKRLVLGVTGSSVILANPTFLEAVKSGTSSPVAFPGYDIFSYDSDTYLVLRDEWENFGVTNPDTWKRLVPYHN